MKVSRKKAEDNHHRVIDTAARLFRKHGFDGIGIVDLMESAGLTHGGFYGRFSSKEELVSKASARAAEQARLGWGGPSGEHPDMAFRTLVGRYVSKEHCCNPESGCILPALAADAARRDNAALQIVFAETISSYRQRLVELRTAMPRHMRRRDPAAILCEMVGAVLLARAAGSSHVAEDLLGAVAADLTRGPGRR